MSNLKGENRKRKPDWLRIELKHNQSVSQVEELLEDLSLHTVCKEAFCPNRMECYRNKSATFMILGNRCSRNCTFCNVTHHKDLLPVDPQEAVRIATAVERLGLQYVVITSVTRDDLPLGGAEQFVEVIQALEKLPKAPLVEVLIPDFQGSSKALEMVVEASPRVLNHNIETIERLYSDLRPAAKYHRSLELLQRAKEIRKAHVPTPSAPLFTKSGFMVGVGEDEEEVCKLLRDLRQVDCDLVTIGQYLQPSKNHFPLVEYITPEQFNRYREYAKELGFKGVASGPLVRSSYNAVEMIKDLTDE